MVDFKQVTEEVQSIKMPICSLKLDGKAYGKKSTHLKIDNCFYINMMYVSSLRRFENNNRCFTIKIRSEYGKGLQLNYVGESAESISNVVNNGGYLFLPSDNNHFNFDQFKTTF